MASLANREVTVGIEELDSYEADLELAMDREYRDVVPMFRYAVETERRFYLANEVRTTVHDEGGRTRLELELRDAWVWDLYRRNRFVPTVRVITFKDVNVEELPHDELGPVGGAPDGRDGPSAGSSGGSAPG